MSINVSVCDFSTKWLSSSSPPLSLSPPPPPPLLHALKQTNSIFFSSYKYSSTHRSVIHFFPFGLRQSIFMELSEIFHVNLFLSLNIHICVEWVYKCTQCVCVCAFHFRWNWPPFFKRNDFMRALSFNARWSLSGLCVNRVYWAAFSRILSLFFFCQCPFFSNLFFCLST